MPEQVVILAGGLGSRLGALTAATPKPLLPCGDRPFLAWLLQGLSVLDIDHVLLLTAHQSDAMMAAVPKLNATLPRPLRITCVREIGLAGTGGALVLAQPVLAERFILCNGDSWLDFDLHRLVEDAAHDPTDVTRMVVRQLDDASRFGVAETDGDLVIGFRERAVLGTAGLINAGIYLFDRSGLTMMPPVCSLECDILPELASRDKLRATIADGFFIDIGVPGDFLRAQTEIPAHFNQRTLP